MEQFVSDSVVADMNLKLAQPPVQLQVKYEKEVTPGIELTPTQVKDVPTVEFDADSGSYYTLVMHDPDAPSRENPKFGEWHHWLVVNIPGNDVSKGEVKSEYIGAGPPENTGLHRYVFLVYKQPGKLDFSELTKLSRRTDNRAKHKISQFVSKYGLQEEIVASNYFKAEWDDYVPRLYEELAGGKK